jgi:putative tricarboxylic transport membrane protein
MMLSANRIAGAFFLLLGLGAVIGAVRLQVGNLDEPQPGFFPFVSGLLLMVLSAILIVRDWRGHSYETEAFGDVRPPLFALLGLSALVVLLTPLGYVVATAILAIVLLFVLGVRKIWVFAVAVPAVSIGSYALFDRLLDVPLPAGPLATWIGL